VKRHNKGQVSSTKKRCPFVLLHTEEFVDYGQARKREKFLKSGLGHQEIKNILEGRIPNEKNSG
jgi:putative endonuclease